MTEYYEVTILLIRDCIVWDGVYYCLIVTYYEVVLLLFISTYSEVVFLLVHAPYYEWCLIYIFHCSVL